MGEQFTVIGKPVPQKDGVERVTGKAKYFGDVMLPHMLHVKILRSPYAQADILDIDTREAEAFPGVELVMSHKNYPKFFRRDMHYVGDEVAAVIAVDEETAEEACHLLRVSYDPKPFVLDMKEAMKPEAPGFFSTDPTSGPVGARDLNGSISVTEILSRDSGREESLPIFMVLGMCRKDLPNAMSSWKTVSSARAIAG